MNPAGEVHEQLDLWSYDRARGRVMLRIFDTLGFTCTFIAAQRRCHNRLQIHDCDSGGESMSRVEHWDGVYTTKQPERLSWFQPHLDLSLELLERAGLSRTTRIIDIGAGASTLVDDLLARGMQALMALDISAAALQVTRDRLRERADLVRWIVSDVTHLNLPPSSVDIWHDRATLHFLMDPLDVHSYVQVASRVVTPGGHAVIGGFAMDGPEQCSLLPVMRRDPEQIAELFAKDFVLVAARRESHTTPGGSLQRFAYALLRKREA